MREEVDLDDPFRLSSRNPTLCPDDFRDRKLIGRGKDSTIYSATCASLGEQPVAVKLYNKDRVSAPKLRAIKREAAMMSYITRKQVPNVTRLQGAFQDPHQVWIVMELGPGGDLLERFLAEGRIMTEARVCRKIAVPLLVSLKALHDLHIIHRDVKLENVFLTKECEIMLGDFGLTMSTKQEMAISPVGTVEYMAPEIVALPPVEAVARGLVRMTDITPCTDRVDIWALGVTLYELLAGRLPFDGRDKQQVKRNITAGRMRALPLTLSAPAINFVVSMLEYHPAQRPSAAELLNHPFVLQHLSPLARTIPTKDLTAPDGLPDGLESEDVALPDKKLYSIQDLAQLSRTSVESGPLIMARHGSPLALLTDNSSGASSVGSEVSVASSALPCHSRSRPSTPPRTRMSHPSGTGPPRPPVQRFVSQEAAGVGKHCRPRRSRDGYLTGRLAVSSTSGVGSPLRPTPQLLAPSEPAPLSPPVGVLGKLTAFVRALFV